MGAVGLVVAVIEVFILVDGGLGGRRLGGDAG